MPNPYLMLLCDLFRILHPVGQGSEPTFKYSVLYAEVCLRAPRIPAPRSVFGLRAFSSSSSLLCAISMISVRNSALAAAAPPLSQPVCHRIPGFRTQKCLMRRGTEPSKVTQ